MEIVELRVEGDAAAWSRAGFAIDDDCVVVGTVRMRFALATTGIASWVVRGIDAVSTIDGIATDVVDAELAIPSAHPNGARLIDHVVITTPDVDRTVAAFVAAGCQLKRERLSDSQNAPMRQAFIRAGEVILEIVGPVDVQPSDGVSRPAQLWGLAFTVEDLDSTAAFFGDALRPAKAAVQAGRRIATLRGDAVGITIPTVFMSP